MVVCLIFLGPPPEQWEWGCLTLSSSRDSLTPTGLPHPSLIMSTVPRLIQYYYAMFRTYSGQALSFLKRNRGGMDLREMRGEVWRNEKDSGRGICGQDVLKTKNQNKNKVKEESLIIKRKQSQYCIYIFKISNQGYFIGNCIVFLRWSCTKEEKWESYGRIYCSLSKAIIKELYC